MLMVVNATGRLGGRAAHRLLIRDETVRAVCRPPAKAEELKQPVNLTCSKDFVGKTYA